MQDRTQPVITLTGEKVALGPIHRGLIEINHRWINQLKTSRYLNMGVVSMDAEEGWYERLAKGENVIYFAIYEASTLQPIGGVNLHKIDKMNRTAELGIMIGEESIRGRGYGTEAVSLMCDFGFNALGLNSIMLMTYEWNIAGQKAYGKAGFQEMGRRRKVRWFAGRYWDDIYYDLLASEFESPVVRDMILDGVEMPENGNEADQ